MGALIYADGRVTTRFELISYRGCLGYVPFGLMVMAYGLIPDGTLPKLF